MRDFYEIREDFFCAKVPTSIGDFDGEEAIKIGLFFKEFSLENKINSIFRIGDKLLFTSFLDEFEIFIKNGESCSCSDIEDALVNSINSTRDKLISLY